MKVTLALPPDTDTPGFTNENKSKPLETMLISEAAKLFTPEEVGSRILHDTLVIYLNWNLYKISYFIDTLFRMEISSAL